MHLKYDNMHLIKDKKRENQRTSNYTGSLDYGFHCFLPSKYPLLIICWFELSFGCMLFL
jgi:hypothetical protein